MNLNVFAPFSQTGYGIATHNICEQLKKQGVSLKLFPIGGLDLYNYEETTLGPNFFNNTQYEYDGKAVCLKIWHQHDAAMRIGTGKYFFYPFFELDTFTPRELISLRVPDELIVSSKWAQQIVEQNGITTKTSVVPLGIDPTIFSFAKYKRASGPYTFIHIGKWEKRKGHDILPELFDRAFGPKDDVRLLVMPHARSGYTEAETKHWLARFYESRNYKKIKIVDTLRRHQDVAQLIGEETDCGLFPNRAEGWNLDLLEVMSMGKPVITTNYSAHTEFCTKENAFLVEPTSLEKANDGKWFHGTGNWMEITESNKDEIVEYMRYCYLHRPTNSDGIKTGKVFTWENSAKKLIEILKKN